MRTRFDHVGITVSDLDGAVGFFVRLGFEVEGRTFLEGPFLDAVVGLTDARTELVVLRLPGGGTGIELTRFLRPEAAPGEAALATRLGLSNVTLEVHDLDAVVVGLDIVGGIGDHEGAWRMASVRGPDGIIVNLAERS